MPDLEFCVACSLSHWVLWSSCTLCLPAPWHPTPQRSTPCTTAQGQRAPSKTGSVMAPLTAQHLALMHKAEGTSLTPSAGWRQCSVLGAPELLLPAPASPTQHPVPGPCVPGPCTHPLTHVLYLSPVSCTLYPVPLYPGPLYPAPPHSRLVSVSCILYPVPVPLYPGPLYPAPPHSRLVSVSCILYPVPYSLVPCSPGPCTPSLTLLYLSPCILYPVPCSPVPWSPVPCTPSLTLCIGSSCPARS